MSTITPRVQQRPPVTLELLRAKRARGEPIVMLTAYDYPGAQIIDVLDGLHEEDVESRDSAGLLVAQSRQPAMLGSAL